MATLNVRVDDKLKKQASELFSDLGLDMSTAINIFLRQAVIYEGLPFDVKRGVPNKMTMDAIAEADSIAHDPNAKD